MQCDKYVTVAYSVLSDFAFYAGSGFQSIEILGF